MPITREDLVVLADNAIDVLEAAVKADVDRQNEARAGRRDWGPRESSRPRNSARAERISPKEFDLRVRRYHDELTGRLQDYQDTNREMAEVLNQAQLKLVEATAHADESARASAAAEASQLVVDAANRLSEIGVEDEAVAGYLQRLRDILSESERVDLGNGPLGNDK